MNKSSICRSVVQYLQYILGCYCIAALLFWLINAAGPSFALSMILEHDMLGNLTFYHGHMGDKMSTMMVGPTRHVVLLSGCISSFQ